MSRLRNAFYASVAAASVAFGFTSMTAQSAETAPAQDKTETVTPDAAPDTRATEQAFKDMYSGSPIVSLGNELTTQKNERALLAALRAHHTEAGSKAIVMNALETAKEMPSPLSGIVRKVEGILKDPKTYNDGDIAAAIEAQDRQITDTGKQLRQLVEKRLKSGPSAGPFNDAADVKAKEASLAATAALEAMVNPKPAATVAAAPARKAPAKTAALHHKR